MKKKRVNELLSVQKKKRRILMSSIFSFVVLLVSSILLVIFINKNQTYYVNYKENSNLDYKVYLKENDYFKENYLKKDNEYISTLIDYIDADFNYNLEMNEEVSNYEYSYYIVAKVNVKEKNSDNTIYESEDILVNKENFFAKGDDKIAINENVIIDYNKYNRLISEFVKIYNLEEAVSSLNVSMYVDVVGTCADYKEESYNESVVTIDIPLTTNTLSIDLNYDLVDNIDGVMACKEDNEQVFILLVVSILGYCFAAWLIISMVKYIHTTRNAESIYNRELKKILNNYSSYIQKINNSFKLDGYQALKVDSFNDILEIRDTIQEPILMLENDDKNGVYFLVQGRTNVVYLYRLKVCDIQEQIEDEN